MTRTRTIRLLEVLKQSCNAQRGRRAALSSHCEVNPRQVSAWFADPPREFPSSESTLAAVEWLRSTDPAAFRVFLSIRRAK